MVHEFVVGAIHAEFTTIAGFLNVAGVLIGAILLNRKLKEDRRLLIEIARSKGPVSDEVLGQVVGGNWRPFLQAFASTVLCIVVLGVVVWVQR